MCKSGLVTINRSLAQARTVSWFTRVLVWLGGLHIGAEGTLLCTNKRTSRLLMTFVCAQTNVKIVDLFKDARITTSGLRVEFDCPGHGKGPWDGLGVMVKTKVTLDIMYGKEFTMAGKITSPILVVQHL
jgi:hypothetical protein